MTTIVGQIASYRKAGTQEVRDLEQRVETLSGELSRCRDDRDRAQRRETDLMQQLFEAREELAKTTVRRKR